MVELIDISEIVRAVRLLAGDDRDYARLQNGIGYNKIDASFGHNLAKLDPKSWSPRQARAAWRMLEKYKGQLSQAGIEYDQLPVPPVAVPVLPPAGGIDYQDNLFRIRWPFGPRFNEIRDAVKTTIPGRAFNKENPNDQHWTAPRMPEAIKGLIALRDEFQFTMTDRAVSELERVGGEMEAKGDRSRARVSELVIEGLGRTLDPVQVAGVEYIAQSKRVIVGDDVGLGKTAEAIAAVHYMDNYPCLVVVPSIVKINWVREIAGDDRSGTPPWLPGKRVAWLSKNLAPGKWRKLWMDYNADPSKGVLKFRKYENGLQPQVIAPPGKLQNGARASIQPGAVHAITGNFAHGANDMHALAKSDMVIINYDILNSWLPALMALPFKAVIIDESHYVKSSRATRTQATRRVAQRIPTRLLLSGTPILNKPIEIVPQLQIADRLNDMGGWNYFVERYCNPVQMPFGGTKYGANKATLPEMNQRMRQMGIYLRREHTMEKPHEESFFMEITNRADYIKAEEDIVEWFAKKAAEDKEFLESIKHLPYSRQQELRKERYNSAVEKARRAEALIRLMTLRKLAAIGKVKPTVDWVKAFLEETEGLDQGNKVIVFAHHIEVQKEYVEAFPGCAHILGEDAIKVRDAEIFRFQNDPTCRVVVCSLKAAGVGVTLHAANQVVLGEFDWTPASMHQAIGRAWRRGQELPVTAWWMTGDNTIDQDVLKILSEKEEIVQASVIGDEFLGDGTAVRALIKGLVARHKKETE